MASLPVTFSNLKSYFFCLKHSKIPNPENIAQINSSLSKCHLLNNYAAANDKRIPLS